MRLASCPQGTYDVARRCQVLRERLPEAPVREGVRVKKREGDRVSLGAGLARGSTKVSICVDFE